MPSCRTCTHPQRHAIESALLAGESERTVADRHKLARSSLRRHGLRHLPAHLARAAAVEAASAAADLLFCLRQELARADRAIERAEDDEGRAREIAAGPISPGVDRPHTLRALAIAARARDSADRPSTRRIRLYELIARMRGVLQERPPAEPWSPFPESAPDTERHARAIRRLLPPERDELWRLTSEAERLVERGESRLHAPDSNPNGSGAE
jgi:hypothetical protein